MLAQLAQVEGELRRLGGGFPQRDHRRGQRRAGAFQVDGHDGLELEGAGDGAPARGEVAGEPGRLHRAAGDDDGIGRLPVDQPAAPRCLQSLNALRAELGASREQPVARRCRQQGAQAAPWQQQVRAAWAAEQRVLQHAQEDLRARLRRRRVQGGDAQRIDQVIADRAWQAGAELGHRQRRVAAEAAHRPAAARHQEPHPVGPGPGRAAQHPAQEGERGRAAGQGEGLAVGITQPQRHAQQVRLGVGADATHQRQRCRVGADQDVLAVVQRRLAAFEAARPAAERRRHLEQRDGGAQRDRLHGCGQAGPAAADDGDAGHLSARASWSSSRSTACAAASARCVAAGPGTARPRSRAAACGRCWPS